MLKSIFKVKRVFAPIYTGGHAAVTSDEKFLISTVDAELHVTDLASGLQVMKLIAPDEVTCFGVKPDGKHILAASRSLLLSLFDMSTGELLRSWKAHDAPVLAMAVDQTSTLIATGSADSTIRVWDVDKGHGTHLFKGHSGVISALEFHTDSNGQIRLASASDDCKVRIWDLQLRRCIAVLEGHVSVVRGLKFAAGGSNIITGGRDKVINRWDLETNTMIRTIPTHESIESIGVLDPKTNSKLGVHGSDILVFTAGERGTVRLWNLTTGDCISTQSQVHGAKHEYTSASFHPKSRQIICVTSDHNILFLNAVKNLEPIKHIVGYNEDIVDLAFVGENDSHLAVASNSEQIRVYDLESSNCDILTGHVEFVVCLDKAKAGDLLISGSKDRTAHIWKLSSETNKFVHVGTCVGHADAIGAVAFSRKTPSFALTGSQDKTVKMWPISNLAIQNGPVKLKSQFTIQAHDKDINSITVAPNDKVFATGSQDKTAKVWSCVDGSLLGVCKGHKRGVWSVQFSPVDQVLATCSGDKTIKLWSVSDFTCLKTLEGHLNTVLKVSFVSLGMQLVSSGSDGLVKLWTIKDNDCVATLDNHEDRVWALGIGKGEKLIASGGADSTITIWEDWTEQEQEEQARKLEEKVQSEQEMSNYIQKKDYINAAKLAMSLNQPYKMLGLLTEIRKVRFEPDSVTGSKVLDQFFCQLSPEELERLFNYVRDWNTNTKHSRTAQNILNLLLTNYTAPALLALPHVKEILESLIPYTERHYSHAEDLLKRSFVVNHVLARMDDFLTEN